jgi:hypothetical protein
MNAAEKALGGPLPLPHPPGAPPGGGHAPLGYWSPRTASVNWCEPDYVYTPYVAEFWNTLSSVPIALLGALATYNAIRYGAWVDGRRDCHCGCE